MNTKTRAKTFKQNFVSAIAISLMTLPLLASAGEKRSVIFTDTNNLDNATDQEVLYSKLKDASREMCGSSNIQETGSLERVRANDECYEGTLRAAVERLNNSDIKELHQQNS